MSYQPLYKRVPRSMASIKKEYMKAMNEQTIDLYPVQESPKPPSFQYRINEKGRIRDMERACLNDFREDVQKTILSNGLYYGLLEDVMDDRLFSTHQKVIVANMVRKLVNESNYYDMVNDLKYKSVYIAPIGLLIEDCCEKCVNKAKHKIKEGLSEKDAYEIEDRDVENFIVDVKDRIPKDITKTISDRVQKSIDDFIETNRKNKHELKQIYDGTKDKIEMLKQAQQQDQFTNPPMDNPDNPMPPTDDEYNQMQQEALAIAKGKERELLEADMNVFGAMTRSLMESIHNFGVLKEAYTSSYDDSINFDKVIGDVTSMYTFLETMNTLNIIDVSPEYLKKELNSLIEDSTDPASMASFKQVDNSDNNKIDKEDLDTSNTNKPNPNTMSKKDDEKDDPTSEKNNRLD